MKGTILFITETTCGGAERMTLLYAAILREAGYDCRLLVLQLIESEFYLEHFIPADLPYEIIRCKRRFLPYYLTRHIQRMKPDCVFVSFLLHAILTLFAKFFSPNVKVVFRDSGMPHTHKKREVKLSPYFLSRGNAFISQTKEMKLEMIEYYQLPPEAITVIHNPIDKNLIYQKIEERFEFPEKDCKHYVAVSRVSPEKDLVTMLYAFSIVLHHQTQSRLSIIGPISNNEYKQQLDNIIEELNIIDKVTFEGFQPNPYKFIEASDVFLLSSVYEGMPNSMLDAMYLGKPVVATKCIPFISQAIHEGYNGFSVPVGDIEDFAEGMLKACAINIRKRFIDQSSSEKQIVKLFDELLNQ